jgi:hypothetical protein
MTDSDQEFIRDVCYFWREKGDPTRLTNWDEKRCQQLMPAFFEAWSKAKAYEELTNLAARSWLDKLA